VSSLFVPLKKASLVWTQGVPFSTQYKDVYHSSASGLDQSRYVFVEGNNLITRWQSLAPSEKFTLAETGFGLGLNFLLSWKLWEQHAPKTCQLHFISCEKHPLNLQDLIKALRRWPQLKKYADELITGYPVLTPGYHQLSFCEGRVRLTLMLGDVLECYEQLLICGDSILEPKLRASYIDAWYLDGFSPEKNKNMWSEPLMQIIALLSKKGTTLATYTVAGSVKAHLRQQGFTVEKKKGFGPKRHMLTACFDSFSQYSLKKPHTPWHAAIPKPYSSQSAIIVGAGLAGCFTAYSLAKRGWKITLIDELPEAGRGASGNQQAVLFPKLSAYNSPLTQFMLWAFLYAIRTYQSIVNQAPMGELKGSLLLAYNQKEETAQASLSEWLTAYPELGLLVDSLQASELTGISLNQGGLFVPYSGWLNAPDLCRFLINREEIKLIKNTSVKQLVFDKKWKVNDWEAEVVILANGHKITSFEEANYLPIKPIRGQMSVISATQESASLQIPLCAQGHLLPSLHGVHHFGATYELKVSDSVIKNQDDLLNLNKLKQLASDILWPEKILDHWAGVRATTPDYLPVVGPLPNKSQFSKFYSGLQDNSKRWIPGIAPYYPGLYACTGFGSRGLTTVPLCAEWLASLINHEFGFLSRTLQQALSPARFLRKNIIRKNNS
jgi:tRNA 5-methylaminomethyl-2-thiouridine biosynthesis bifunctional protein